VQFAQALKHQPNDIQLLLQLGVCCFKTKDAAAARTCYERVLHLSPGHDLATENLGALNLFSASAALLH
jgi:Flp pilus assembly protein TadD